MAGSFSRMLVAAAAAGLAAWFATPHLEQLLGTAGIPARAVVLGVILVIAGTVYLAACWLFRIEEAREIFERVRGRSSHR